MAYLEVPKKAGKSELAAGLALLVLLTTRTRGCQVYGAASATRQAMNVYRAACKMVEQSTVLKTKLRVLRGTNRILKRSDPDSFYAAVAADGDFGDGVNPACVIADEIHRWKTRKQLDNWDVLSNGGITRRQTLTIAITTAGIQNESPLAWRPHEKSRKIEEGIVSDAKFYGRIYGAAKEDDPSDPATWVKANPSLKQNGGFLDIEKIRQQYVSHAAEGDLTSFKRYFLNMWDQKESRAIDLEIGSRTAASSTSRRFASNMCRTPPRATSHRSNATSSICGTRRNPAPSIWRSEAERRLPRHREDSPAICVARRRGRPHIVQTLLPQYVGPEGIPRHRSGDRKQNGGFLDIEKIRQQYVSHAAEGDLTSFKRYFLNMWDQKESRAIDLEIGSRTAASSTSRRFASNMCRTPPRATSHRSNATSSICGTRRNPAPSIW